MAAQTALASASKSVRDEAKGLARTAATKQRKKLQTEQKIKAPVLATVGAGALGLAERFLPEVQVPGIDNGVTLGLPMTLAGAFLPGKLGEYLMLAGSGILASGARSMARTLGADADLEGI